MCGVGGVVGWGGNSVINFRSFLDGLTERGRDSVGMFIHQDGEVRQYTNIEGTDGIEVDRIPTADTGPFIMMANCRAKPTSHSEGNVEMVELYQQPYLIYARKHHYRLGPSGVHLRAAIHNGTIANDAAFNKSFRFFGQMDESVVPIDSSILLNYSGEDAIHAIRAGEIKGSFSAAIWDDKDREVVLLKNYLPMHLMIDYDNSLIWWANVESAFGAYSKGNVAIYDVPAYTSVVLDRKVNFRTAVNQIRIQLSLPGDLYAGDEQEKALVVCSGGLDSTTVAALAVNQYGPENVTLLHFHYGCKAEDREHERIIKIADRMGCSYQFVDLYSVFQGMKSPILGKDGNISEGDEGVEFAKEWVPARNLIMMSVAIGIAESGGYTTIQLGANLTEQAAFPDNSLDFIDKLNTLAPYAVQNNKRIRVEAPLVNLMKQEIVAEGNKVDTPYDLTWSCYHDGEEHCGKCAPCQMRQQAFEMNGLKDPVFKGQQ